MTEVHANLNRPVHLARRNAFFEKAVEMIGQPLEAMAVGDRLHHTRMIGASLVKAREHAAFASRSGRASGKEMDFLHFLDLVLDSVESADAMIQHQLHLSGEEGFLGRFLGVREEDSVLSALHYQRRSEDIHQGLWHLLRLAQPPYEALRHASLSSMSDDEKERYHRAYASFRKEARARFSTESPP